VRTTGLVSICQKGARHSELGPSTNLDPGRHWFYIEFRKFTRFDLGLHLGARGKDFVIKTYRRSRSTLPPQSKPTALLQCPLSSYREARDRRRSGQVLQRHQALLEQLHTEFERFRHGNTQTSVKEKQISTIVNQRLIGLAVCIVSLWVASIAVNRSISSKAREVHSRLGSGRVECTRILLARPRVFLLP